MTHTYSEAAYTLPAPRQLRHPVRYRIARLIALLIVGITALSGVIMTPAPAEAVARTGAGGWWTPAGGWLGNYMVGEQRVYCIDILTDTAGSGGAGTLSNMITEGGHGTRPVSGVELRKINYAVSVWGQTSEPIRAAAVSAFVYNFTSANHYGDGPHYITGPHAAAILADYRRVEADTNANFDQGGGVGVATMQLDVDPTNHYLGTLRVTKLSPSNAQGTVTLSHGVFADTGLRTRDGVTDNSSFPVIGVPPEDGSNYRIKAEAAFRGDGKRTYETNVTIYAEGSMQRTAGPGQNRNGVASFSAVTQDSEDRTSRFRPVVGTKVASKFVAQGEEFSDVLTFSTSADQSGLHNPWYQHPENNYAQVKATGTLYGPFLSQPQESDTVPPNSPVVVQGVEIETSPADGPTVDYTVPSGAFADEAGFYTWVWEVSAQQQREATRAFLPEPYEFKDRFGQVSETSITPTSLHISTQVTRMEAGVGESVADEVTVQVLDGGWLQESGSRIPATLTGTAYFTESEPVLADSAPAEAQTVGTFSLTIDKPGSARSEEFTLPLREGYVSFQWCLLEREQPEQLRGMIRETCDLFGQASETVKVTLPSVTTQATPLATVHDEINDVALVTGFVAENLHLDFELYKQPTTGDPRPFNESVEPEERWSEGEIEALGGEAVCQPSNLVHTTERISIEPGTRESDRYTSPAVRVTTEGTYWWVERLVHIDPVTEEVTVVSTGECGLSNETTQIEKPSVTTQAVDTAAPGEEIYDVAKVSGPIPGTESGIRAELTFQVFKNTSGVDSCVPQNLVHSLDEPVLVTSAGSYSSASVTIDTPGEYFWVETLSYVDEAGTRETVHVGKCGLPSETTRVIAELPNTGSIERGSVITSMIIAGVLLGAGLVTMFIARAKRSRFTCENDPS